jgi:hypothetical protein
MNFFWDNPIFSFKSVKNEFEMFRDTKIWITIVHCKNRDWVPNGRNRDHTTLWSIFLCQKEFFWDKPDISNILRAWEMSLKCFRDTKIRITIVRCKNRDWVPTRCNCDYTSLWSIFLCQKEFFLDKPGISNILRAWEMSFLKSILDKKIWISIIRCKNRDWVPIGWNRDHTTLRSIFLCQNDFFWDNPGFSNILRALEMSLKCFRETKIWITIVRCKNWDRVPNGRNRDHKTLWSIFLCQK